MLNYSDLLIILKNELLEAGSYYWKQFLNVPHFKHKSSRWF